MSNSPRYGSRLQHGRAHEADHRSWSRRDFLGQLCAGGLASSFLLNSQIVQAFSHHPLAAGLQSLDSDRILVLIQLNGGNDGLNTVIPIQNDRYYQVRPNISIAGADALSLTSDFGLHPALSGLQTSWNDGNLGIVHSVGYPDPNLSHFRSTDIWSTASNSDEYLSTGWLGRHFDTEFPDFTATPPDYPLAVQLGQASSFILQGPVGPMGMNIANQSILDRLTNGGQLYDEVNVPNSFHGAELSFLRTIANDAYQYAGVISEALDQGGNAIEYPSSNPLGNDLASVARMIKGGLPSRIYLVSMGGYDTHANQLFRHEGLMEDLGNAMKAFYDDLSSTGHSEQVLMMTFSEFGRRVEENGSRGTDHGTAAPLFVMGDGVEDGFYGQAPDLLNLDNKDNLQFSTDFRSVYATVLEGWLGVNASNVDALFNQPFDRLGFVNQGTSVQNEEERVGDFSLHQNYPNPFATRTDIGFTLSRQEDVRITVYNMAGQRVDVITDRTYAQGSHHIQFDASELPSGTYVYRLEAGARALARQLTVVK